MGRDAGDLDHSLVLRVREAGERGTTADELADRLDARPARVADALDRSTADATILRVEADGERYLDPAVFPAVAERARSLLTDAPGGLPQGTFLDRLLPGPARVLGAVYLRYLVHEKVAVIDGERVRPPGRRAPSRRTDDAFAERLLRAIEAEGLTPPSPATLARRLGAKPQILAGVQEHLIEQRRLVRLPHSELIVSTAAIEALSESLAATGWERFELSTFKDHFDLSRKWAIPLLEHLDTLGVTRRIGNERQLIRRA